MPQPACEERAQLLVDPKEHEEAGAARARPWADGARERRALVAIALAGAALCGSALYLGQRGVHRIGEQSASEASIGFSDFTQDCSWLANDNCDSSDTSACWCRDLNPNGPCGPCRSPQADPQAANSPPRADAAASEPASAGAPPQRKGSFLVIGDWGYDFACHGDVPGVGCQQAIADRMLQKMDELGDVKFIINIGDSFYPHGVMSKSDPQWESKWRSIFPKKLRDVPWYSVYGNHDFQHDPGACSMDIAACAQVNSNLTDLNYFYMPDVNWFKDHPELGIEIVALELNHFMLGWDQSKTKEDHFYEDCQYTACEEACKEISKARAMAAFKLFNERIAESTAKNMVVFSHYPTDYFTAVPEFLDALRDASKRNILFLGGHRHNIDQTSTTSIQPNENWLVGGGGGWSCDGPSQGFLVGEIGSDDKLTTYPELVEESLCCQSPAPSPWKGEGCAWLGCDNCIDPQMCECRANNPNGPCGPCPNSTAKGRICSGTSCSDGYF